MLTFKTWFAMVIHLRTRSRKKHEAVSVGLSSLLEFLQRPADLLWSCHSLPAPNEECTIRREVARSNEHWSWTDSNACPWPLSQRRTKARFSFDSSLCSSLCFQTILLTEAVTL
jgi:hypothetical protein